MLKSGTSVGANIREALRGQPRQDFAAKMNKINETEYWLELLYRTDYITDKEFRSIFADCKELVKILTSIVKTTREKNRIVNCEL